VEIGFAEALLVVGAVLALASGLSGWLHGTVLSISVLSLGAGVGLSIAGILTVDPATELVLVVVELALLLTLFADGLLVEDQLPANRMARSRSRPRPRHADHAHADRLRRQAALLPTCRGRRRSCSARCSPRPIP